MKLMAVRMGRSQAEKEHRWTLDEGWRAPIDGLHGHALVLHLRLRRGRIKILMSTSRRCVGRGREEWTVVNRA